MTDSKMDEVKSDRKLKGKTNFVSWKREFERAAKTNDILEYLTGEEVVPPKPKKEDYFGRFTKLDTRRLTRSMTASTTPTPSTEGDENLLDAQQPAANQALRWQIDSSEYKNAKEQMRLAGRLLDAWVSDGINAIPFYGSRPQPDYSLGFKREAFTRERLQKLQPFIGNELEDCSYFAATYDMYFPFLTSEVKCGASALNIADRQNAHSQTVALRGLIELFRLVGREDELHQEINGFSISHSDEYVRIWGHYAVINGNDFTFYRHPIAKFDISKTEQGDNRWTAYTFVQNIYDLWLPERFLRICSVIDMLPADLNFKVSEQPKLQTQDPELASSRSELSQQLEGYSLADKGVIPDSQPSVNPITPEVTINTGSSNSKKKKTK